MLTRIISSPEPGDYVLGTRGDGTRAYIPPGAMDEPSLSIGIEDGRYLETTWNFDAGYYWFDQLERVGFFYDKIIAMQVLVDPTTYFIGRDTDSDIRRYQINFASSFGPSTIGLIRGVLSEDWSRIHSGTIHGDRAFLHFLAAWV